MLPEICPNCGVVVPRNAKACPGCGSDEKTGWSSSASEDKLGIPEEEFDYDDFVKEEFNPAPVKPRGVHWFWWLTALLLILAFLFFWLR